MIRVHRMLLAVAAACFVAGVGVGLALPVAAEQARAEGPLTADQRFVRDYLERFREAFDPSADQERKVRAVLWQHVHDRNGILASAGPEQWPPEVRSELNRADRRMNRRIEFLLDERQRELYRAWLDVEDVSGPTETAATRPQGN